MCGRYASTRSAADLAALFEVEDLTEGDLVADYNVAPTDPAPIVLGPGSPRARHPAPGEGGPALCVARWGFLPWWARDARDAARMINARVETVAGSRVFGAAFAERRCLVPADGWYEWCIAGDTEHGNGRDGRPTKRPYFMTRPEPVVFGGVWSQWGTDETSRLTFSIITMPAIGPLAGVHGRMPFLLDASRWAAWLHGDDPATLLTPPSAQYCAEFEIRPVSAAVGDVRKDGPELVRRVTLSDPDVSTVDSSPTLF